MRDWPDESVGLIVTSPPLQHQKQHRQRPKKRRRRQMAERPPTKRLHRPQRHHATQKICPMAARLPNRNAPPSPRRRAPSSTTTNGASKTAFSRTAPDIMAGLPVRQIIIWQRIRRHQLQPKPRLLPPQLRSHLPPLQTPASSSPPKPTPSAASGASTKKPATPHPAPFPVELATAASPPPPKPRSSTPFIGSGTTAIAAERAGHPWTGIEQSPEYIALAEQRIQKRPPIATVPQ